MHERTNASLGHELLFALCHEMGNLVGAIRLQTHLIDQEMRPRDLVVARSEIDVLGARMSALLALVRPSVGDVGREHAVGVHGSDVMAAVEHGLDTLLVPGVELAFERAPGDALLRIDRSALQALVASFAHLAVEQVRPRGRVLVASRPGERGTDFVIEDDGPADSSLVEWSAGPWRGRALLCALAHELLDRCGGSIEATSTNGRSRVVLHVCRVGTP